MACHLEGCPNIDTYSCVVRQRDELRASLARAEAERDAAQRSNVAFIDSNTRMSTVVHAAILWHRGETQPEEHHNDDGLRAAVSTYLASEPKETT